MLVPHSECQAGSEDLYGQYELIRHNNAIPRDSLLQIQVPTGTQPCSRFGVHPSLSTLKHAYADGDLSFVANVGTLLQPLSKEDYENGLPRPAFLGAHNWQTLVAQNVHAQETATAKGVLGRILAALGVVSPSGKAAYAGASYSIDGSAKILEGSPIAPEMLTVHGAVPLTHHDALIGDINQLLSLESNSVFAETYAKLAEKSIGEAKTLQKVLNSNEAALANTFSSDKLSMQLQQVAKVIAARRAEGKERDVFFIRGDGWDSHGMLDDQVRLTHAPNHL